MIGHCRIHFSGQLNESSREIIFSRFPRQIIRIDRNAMPAQAWPRIKRHETKGLGRRRVNDLPDVDAHAAHAQHFYAFS